MLYTEVNLNTELIMYLIDRLWLLKNCSLMNSPDYILAGFFLNQANLTTRHTLATVQESTYISKSTVDRFCKDLGYSNLRSFQKDLLAEFEEYQLKNKTKANSSFENTDYPAFFTSRSVRDTLAKIVSLINESDKLCIYGDPQEIYCFHTLIARCTAAGKEVFVLNDWSLDNAQNKLASCSEKDCLILIDSKVGLKGYEMRMGLYEGLIHYTQFVKLPCRKIFIGKEEPDEDRQFTVLGLPVLKSSDEYRLLLCRLDIYLRERIA